MTTTKAFTDLQQSKKLAEILPIESADVYIANYIGIGKSGEVDGTNIRYCTKGESFGDSEIAPPAWSLAALLSVLPDEITDDGDVYRNMLFHLKGKYIIQYPRLTTLWPSLLSVEADNPIDACVGMIEELHELKML